MITKHYIGELPEGSKITKMIQKRMVRERMNALPNYLTGSLNNKALYLIFESCVYYFMGTLLNKQYNGGYYKFIGLSNGGFYMSLNDKGIFVCAGFQEDYMVTADAASIVSNLRAYEYLSNKAYEQSKERENKLLCERYYQLKDYISCHPEGKSIYAIID